MSSLIPYSTHIVKPQICDFLEAKGATVAVSMP